MDLIDHNISCLDSGPKIHKVSCPVCGFSKTGEQKKYTRHIIWRKPSVDDKFVSDTKPERIFVRCDICDYVGTIIVSADWYV